MARQVKLTPDQHGMLTIAGYGCSVHVDYDTERLAELGLVEVFHGRYGTWARVTDVGRQHLARKRVGGFSATSEQVPAPAKKLASNHPLHERQGPTESGKFSRGAAPRTRSVAANHARARAAIPPPAAAQDVGATSSQAVVGRRRGKASPVRKTTAALSQP